MQVTIAGYNVDRTALKESNPTPETISAAYARISRSKKSVTELRAEAIREVEKARKSNRNIIFDMGHSSIAEHAVFNIDIIGISRYLTEFVQKTRLASFTEKSQRYVTFNKSVVIPDELREGNYVYGKEEQGRYLQKEYHNLIDGLFLLYKDLTSALENCYIRNGYPGSERKMKEMAKEDARYLLPLATETQMGVTINARSIETLLRRLAKSNLSEAHKLHHLLLQQIQEITPSLIRYTGSDKYQNRTLLEQPPFLSVNNTETIDTKVFLNNPDGEDYILAALIFENNPDHFTAILDRVKSISTTDKATLFRQLLSAMKPYHKAPQSFEIIDCTVQMSISASCFAQLKRHRIATLISAPYHPKYGYVTPPAFRNLDLQDRVTSLMAQVAHLFEELEDYKEGLGNYIITNAHRRNVLLKTNLRELYHFVRLRSDEHAQWEIRKISDDIVRQLQNILPYSCCKLMGKSDMDDGNDL